MSWYKTASQIIAYHGTREDFPEFDFSFTPQGIMWFSTNIKDVLDGISGASSSKIIKKVSLEINKPAGRKEYEEMFLDEMRQKGYDGIILEYGYIAVFPEAKITILDHNVSDERK
jgi:hypothetical protein